MRRRLPISVLGLCLPLLLVTPPASAQESPTRSKIAVMDLKDNGVGPEVASLLTGVVCNKLSSFGIFEVISRDDIKNILTHEQDRVLLGCSNDDCLIQLGDALGAKNLIAGSVGKVGDKNVILLQRLEVRPARAAKRVERQFSGNREQMLDQVAIAAHQVVEDILAAQGGELMFTSSEEGADVSIDGRTIGTTPMNRVSVPAGPHDLRIRKEGFVDWVKTIQLQPHEVQVVEVHQIPSGQFIEAYEDRANSMRRWAWISAAAFLAFEATAAGLRTYTWLKYDPIEAEYRKLDSSDGVNKTKYYQDHQDDMKKAEIMDYTALGMGITGGLIGALSLYLFIEGDNPDRYSIFRSVDVKPSPLAPTARIGFGNLSLGWEF